MDLTFDKAAELTEQYLEAQPFPHIIIDQCWNENELNQAVDEIENLPEEIWIKHQDPTAKEMIVQKCKMGLNMPYMLEGHCPTIEKIMHHMNSQNTLQILSKLTGIPNLVSDPYNLGGGVHRIKNGGKLSIHADFNLHPKTKLHRRVNVLIFLNRNWQTNWNGDLELWDHQLKQMHHKISPLFNKMVVFNITDQALHGHPLPLQCPPDRSRFSLAFYYYTKERPEKEKAPFHWANWYKRPGYGY